MSRDEDERRRDCRRRDAEMPTRAYEETAAIYDIYVFIAADIITPRRRRQMRRCASRDAPMPSDAADAADAADAEMPRCR